MEALQYTDAKRPQTHRSKPDEEQSKEIRLII